MALTFMILFVIRIHECDREPCHNNATCRNVLINSFECDCAPGYRGSHCEEEIDECISSPCHNGATCTDLVNNFQCECLPGYTGGTCETEIDECESTPCLNAGSCVDGLAGYTCTCPAGFTGDHCQTDVDECLSGPCQNGGNCTDRVLGYNCSCVTGFVGDSCETDLGATIADCTTKMYLTLFENYTQDEPIPIMCDPGPACADVAGSVWGNSDRYTTDSALCKSAVHAFGRDYVTSDRLLYIVKMGLKYNFKGVSSHGVRSSAYRSMLDAYRFLSEDEARQRGLYLN
eukprot:GHVU01070400.1.p1 GENE.GHVU01070400.1~~GHVU01070400.1.p1  ORF type:complete len:310 (+),score=0.75 GHVU01070400.1:68-931(+)